LWLEPPPLRALAPRIARTTRIGIDYAGDWAQRPWRFFERDSAYVSTAPASARRAAGAAGMPIRNNSRLTPGRRS
jgi:DNA-3-methyladenine glycosylase